MAGSGVLDKIVKEIDRNFPEEVDFLSRMVRVKSLVGQEGEGQDFYAGACRSLGMTVEIFQPEKEKITSHPAYTAIDLDYAGRANVIAELPGAGKGRSLILNGHMD